MFNTSILTCLSLSFFLSFYIVFDSSVKFLVSILSVSVFSKMFSIQSASPFLKVYEIFVSLLYSRCFPYNPCIFSDETKALCVVFIKRDVWRDIRNMKKITKEDNTYCSVRFDSYSVTILAISCFVSTSCNYLISNLGLNC